MEDYLDQASKNMEKNIRLLRDEKKIPTEHDGIFLLNKVQKSLRVIGLDGLALTLQLAETGLDQVRDIRFDSNKTIRVLAACQRITVEASSYLKSLTAGAPDQPTTLYPGFEALGLLLNTPVKVEDLFFPNTAIRADFARTDIIQALKAGIYGTEKNRGILLGHWQKIESGVKIRAGNLIDMLQRLPWPLSAENQAAWQQVCQQMLESLDYAQQLRLFSEHFILCGLHKALIASLSPAFNPEMKLVMTDPAWAPKKKEVIEALYGLMRVTEKISVDLKGLQKDDRTSRMRIAQSEFKLTLLALFHMVDGCPACQDCAP